MVRSAIKHRIICTQWGRAVIPRYYTPWRGALHPYTTHHTTRTTHKPRGDFNAVRPIWETVLSIRSSLHPTHSVKNSLNVFHSIMQNYSIVLALLTVQMQCRHIYFLSAIKNYYLAIYQHLMRPNEFQINALALMQWLDLVWEWQFCHNRHCNISLGCNIWHTQLMSVCTATALVALDNWNELTWVNNSATKGSIRRFVITERASTRAFSWLKAATTTFTF